MKLYKTDKIIYALTGSPEEFLKGMSSNTASAARNAFLDQNGKIVITFDQLRKSEDEYWIICENTYKEILPKHLALYLKINKSHLEKRDYHVYHVLSDHIKLKDDEYSVPQKKGHLIITKHIYDTQVTQEEYQWFRIQNNIPIHGIDYADEMLLNVSETEFVSFDKGCFLGQEILARVHHKSTPPKKLIALESASVDGPQKLTSKTTDPKTGKIWGFLFIPNK